MSRKQVYSLRLVTGEDIFAVVKENPLDYELTRPALVAQRQEGDQIKIGFIPYIQYSEDKPITIKKQHVMFLARPIESFINGYYQTFHSSVIVPETGGGKLLLPS